jgi:hypothetical protein
VRKRTSPSWHLAARSTLRAARTNDLDGDERRRRLATRRASEALRSRKKGRVGGLFYIELPTGRWAVVSRRSPGGRPALSRCSERPCAPAT